MTREEILTGLQQEYAAQRAADLAEFEERRNRACAACPGLQEVMDARHRAVMQGIRDGLVSHSSENMAGHMAEWNEKVHALLRQGGFPEDYLQPVYACPVCRDEGFVYDPSRHMCKCFQKRLAAAMIAQLDMISPVHSFEKFDETVFSQEKSELGPTQRQRMRALKQRCEEYSNHFPDCGNLLLQGKSGLGKTYLMECMAHRLAERGFFPVYRTAYQFFEQARQGYMENNPDRIHSLLEAELLMLDDLGSEPLLNNVTVEQLFNLLNERALTGKHTIISTNLNDNELRERYTERVVSRLLDEKSWQHLVFKGQDVRDNRRKSL